MQEDQIMRWFVTKRKGSQRYATIYWAWRRAGCASSAEPAYRGITRHSGDLELCRGDILAVMPEGRIAVLDCVITHLTAPSYLACASQTAGYAA